LKLGILKEAQAQTNAQVTKITEQVAFLGQEDATRRLASTTTTVITTKSEATGETHIQGSPVVIDKTKTQVETSKSSAQYEASSSAAHAESHHR